MIFLYDYNVKNPNSILDTFNLSSIRSVYNILFISYRIGGLELDLTGKLFYTSKYGIHQQSRHIMRSTKRTTREVIIINLLRVQCLNFNEIYWDDQSYVQLVLIYSFIENHGSLNNTCTQLF